MFERFYFIDDKLINLNHVISIDHKNGIVTIGFVNKEMVYVSNSIEAIDFYKYIKATSYTFRNGWDTWNS